MVETIHQLSSGHLKNARKIWVRRPAGTANPPNLTVFLDGELYRDRIGAVGIIDGLHQAGRIDDSWFVFVSMESPEARWRECPCYPPFARFISRELLPWLEHTHTGVKHARHRVLAGLSYTGLAAAYVASEAPGLFHKVISQSGSFWWNDCWLIKQTDRWSQPLGTEFHLDVGTRETQENVQHREDVLQVVSQIDGVRRFRSLLHSHGHAVRSVEFDGGHEFTAWAGTLPAALAWALPRKPEPIRAPADRE